MDCTPFAIPVRALPIPLTADIPCATTEPPPPPNSAPIIPVPPPGYSLPILAKLSARAATIRFTFVPSASRSVLPAIFSNCLIPIAIDVRATPAAIKAGAPNAIAATLRGLIDRESPIASNITSMLVFGLGLAPNNLANLPGFVF